jgi:hypothetical protein
MVAPVIPPGCAAGTADAVFPLLPLAKALGSTGAAGAAAAPPLPAFFSCPAPACSPSFFGPSFFLLRRTTSAPAATPAVRTTANIESCAMVRDSHWAGVFFLTLISDDMEAFSSPSETSRVTMCLPGESRALKLGPLPMSLPPSIQM